MKKIISWLRSLEVVKIKILGVEIKPADKSEQSSPQRIIDDSRVGKGGYFRSISKFSSHTVGKLLFIYGSLLDVDSLRATIMRPTWRIDCIPLHLKGYRRRWGMPTSKRDYVHSDWSYCEDHIRWLSLLVEKTDDPNDVVPGVVINVDEETELCELRGREENYELNPLPSASLFRLDGNPYASQDEVYTFLPNRSDRFLAGPSSRYRIRQGYVDRINEGLSRIEGFKSSTLMQMVSPNDPVIGPIEAIEAFEPNNLVQRILASRLNKIGELYEGLNDAMIRDGAMWQSDARKRPRPISTALFPVVLPDDVYAEAERLAETAVSLATKATRLVVQDDDLSRRCCLDDNDREWAMLSLDRGDGRVQVTRVDMTYYRGKLNVFEVNADSPGGMYHFDKLSSRFLGYMSSLDIDQIQLNTASLCDAIADQLFEHWRCWVDTGLRQSDDRNALPRIAIVEHDFVRWQSLPEMLNFQKLLGNRMKGKGYVFLCEANTLEYDGNRLTGVESMIQIEKNGITKKEGQRYPIDLVYKRVLHKDLKSEGDEKLSGALIALIGAYRDNRICIVNSPVGLLAGIKSLMAVMHMPGFESRLIAAGLPGLNVDERQLIGVEDQSDTKSGLPVTYLWGEQINPALSGDIEEKVVDEEGSCFVLKPFDDHSGRGVKIKFRQGWKQDFKKLWNNPCDDPNNPPYIVQQFIPHGRLTVPIEDEKQHEIVEQQMYFILGVYVIGGEAMGIEAKLGNDLPISMRVDDHGPRGYRTLAFCLKH
uniref:Uncharacterized protein n=1 Tax=Candidatus Kentrum sp. MB TaxID=2138164 RepID=A0A450XKQ5_9GAMM|nr:MAG: hypothetical protein BECKMB1821G_GA0114241_105518 [Candidatus Kentron sp. MB]VFK33920.1 MAG: hypothetical protein BECKMB1821I_GA0114274_105618 [Candidatus Kentron sp. MB]VFK76516.1 MAG: hypothetical protein BECKMB1821H_GA0114242_106018 [Candidatus Kentron sp. MB]